MAIIRRARLEDARGIHDAHMRSIQEVCSKDHTAEEIAGWGYRPYDQERRQMSIVHSVVWVIENNGAIAGYAAINIKPGDQEVKAHIFGLYLTKEILGQGLGRQTLELMLAEAKSNGVHRVTLESTITAFDFYKSFGFVESGPQISVDIGGSQVRCHPMIKVL